ncbi:hypothetical protein FGK63_09775 [Ruegeria sediminis]|uniref:Uncharacterized protein n=1 Tax=Ruegeria sediminis TaxID=2583820 RepID=A0ABY2WZH1_9RHOB|nr:hypothetical protein [Ruegeria sediminis]TMV07745.1 hypothetical protein FGK63_09775 [Ruegeria sediminis]
MRRFIIALALLSTPAAAQVPTVSGTDGQNSLGTVPCAAVEGQPIESCPAELRHKDDGTTTLAVQLKTGEVRRIYFEGGEATASSSTSKMTTETRGDMLVIFIAPGEVYEIPKAAVAAQ